MKTPGLLIILAVVSTAFALELKNPAVVAEEWNRIVGPASAPHLPPNPIGLAASPSAAVPTHPPAVAPGPKKGLQGDLIEVPTQQIPDKGFRVAVPDGDKLPAGAKPWVYRGKTYWLIPIDSAAGK